MSRPALRIRQSQAEDSEVFYEIDRICFPEDIAFSREDLIACLNHPESTAWLAERTGRILGFVLARIDNQSCAHVLTLDVLPSARKRKVGTMLMKELHAELMRRKIRLSFLEVAVNNIPAQRLYEQLKYRYMGMLPGYYHGREDAYRMVCQIGSPDALGLPAHQKGLTATDIS